MRGWAWLRPRLRVALRGGRGRRALQLLAVAVAGVLVINAGVRVFGGGVPHLLSPLHLGDKVRALGGLALHSVGHLLGDPHGDERAAVSEAARRNGVPVALALSVAHAESLFTPHAISHTGAMGLMQLMPATARAMGVLDPFDARQNVLGGARFLRVLANNFGGDLVLTIAAYNAGEGAVRKYGGIPPYAETRRYVQRVLTHYYAYRAVTTQNRALAER